MLTGLPMLLFAAALAAQPITLTYNLEAAHAANLSVLTMNDSGFTEDLGRFLAGPNAPDFAPILPVVIIVKNNGTHKIGYLNVRYTYIFKDGSEHSGYSEHARNPVMGDQFAPGHEIVIYPGVGVIGHHVTGANPKTVSVVAQQLLPQCQSIEVLIDAITLDDGTLLGPDHSGVARRYRSTRAAIMDAYEGRVESKSLDEGYASDEFYIRTRQRIREHSREDLKRMLDLFAPLKEVTQ